MDEKPSQLKALEDRRDKIYGKFDVIEQAVWSNGPTVQLRSEYDMAVMELWEVFGEMRRIRDEVKSANRGGVPGLTLRPIEEMRGFLTGVDTEIHRDDDERV